MVVGIDHGEDREGDYTHTGRADAWAEFSNRTVVDFIEQRYRRPKHRGLIGSSLAAIEVLLQLEKAPHLFDVVAMLSGTFGYGREENDLFARARRIDLGGHRPTLVFYSGGSHGVNAPGKERTANDNYEETLEMAQLFVDAHGYAWDHDLFHAYAAGVPHGEVPWRTYIGRDQEVKNPVKILEGM